MSDQFGLLLLENYPDNRLRFRQFAKQVTFLGPYATEADRETAIAEIRKAIKPHEAGAKLMKIEGELFSPAAGISAFEMIGRSS